MDVGIDLGLVLHQSGRNEHNFNQRNGFPGLNPSLPCPTFRRERAAQCPVELAGGYSLFLLKFPIHGPRA